MLINTLFINIICNRTQNGEANRKDQRDTRNIRLPALDVRSKTDAWEKTNDFAMTLPKKDAIFAMGKDRKSISGTKEQVKRQEDRDQSEL